MIRIFKYPFYIKIALVIIAIGLSVGTVIYTSVLVSQLQERQKRVAEIWAAALERLASENSYQYDISFIFDEILQSIDFPVVVTDSLNYPIADFHKNILVDSTFTDSQKSDYLKMLVIQFDQIHEPILVTVQDTIILQKIHYGNSPVIDQLQWFPYIQIITIALYVLFGYAAFSIIRRQEQSSVWVGMSKETAHQLGTPISGLLAWIEILKSQNLNHEQSQTIAEMENDLVRLMTVTDRFSKIGAKPKMELCNLTAETENIISYLRKRFFSGNKSGAISIESSVTESVLLNSTLFQWAIENLVKNALDARTQLDPEINIAITEDKKFINIDIADNGKGMSSTVAKNIFRPGFTTKERGWGMGLSLTQRIISDYHRGNIFVLQTEEGKGTCFRIQFKRPK